jgi:RHS repeat-associated protein
MDSRAAPVVSPRHLRLTVSVALSLLLAFAVHSLHADGCGDDDYYEMGCPLPPICGGDCSGTTGGSSSGSTSGKTSGTGGPVQTTPGGPTAPTPAVIRSALQTATNNTIVDSLALQPTPNLENYIVITNAYSEEAEGETVNDSHVPPLRAQATPRVPQRLPHTEPVASDGEFVVDETDVTLPGIGIPFTFSRHYRSGVDYQTPLGFGWNHTFNQRLVIADAAYGSSGASTAPPDMFLINDRLEQLRFSFSQTLSDGDDLYVLQMPGIERLLRTHNVAGALWRLDDGSGVIYQFDGGDGTLQSIVDTAGHQIRIHWGQASPNAVPIVLNVVDTTGRTIFFVYETLPGTVLFPSGHPQWAWTPNDNYFYSGTQVDAYMSQGPTSFTHLRCLNLAPNCTNAMVSFQVSPVAAVGDDQRLAWGSGHAVQAYNVVNYAIEFDLTRVQDPKGNGPTYKYYPIDANYYAVEQDAKDQNSWYFQDAHIYQKEWDKYWPSQYASQLYQYFQTQIPALKAECPASAQQAVTISDSLWWPWFAICDTVISSTPDPVCEAKEVVRLTKACEDAVPKDIKALKSRISPTFQYGVPPQLIHNLVEIDDAEGRPVVQNTYGTDTTGVDFDRVTVQVLGGDPEYTTVFSYTDGTRVGALQSAAFANFHPTHVCPRTGTTYGPATISGNTHTDQYQSPALKTVIQGPLGRTTTLFMDANGEVLQSIDAAGLATNFNYSAAALQGVLLPTGERTCIQYDDGGRPTLVTRLPAASMVGDILATTVEYDSAEKLIHKVESAAADVTAERWILRDSLERILGIGDVVDASQTDWTCFEYTDSFYGAATIGPRLRIAAEGLPPPPSPAGSGTQEIPIRSRPCGFQVTPSTDAAHAVIPSRITRPDGTVTQLSNISVGGPGEIVLDATGAAPVDRYFLYDTYGRVSQTGLRDFAAKSIVASSVETWDIDPQDFVDLEGLVKASHVADATDPTKTVDSIFTYDASRNLTGVVTPLVSTQFVRDVFGDTVTQIERPQGGPGASGAVRIACRKYNAYGQTMEEIAPEGGVTDFTYDMDGRLTAVSMGPETQTTVGSGAPHGVVLSDQNLPPTCSPVVSPGGASGQSAREIVAQYSYNSVGQMSSATQFGRSAQYTYDGLGRMIDAYVPDHHPSSGSPLLGGQAPVIVGYHHALGYHGTDVAWTLIADQFPSGGILPPYLTSGVHAAIEYTYDQLHRPTQIKQWQFTESPVLAPEAAPYAVTSLSYDDSKNSVQVIDPQGVTFAETLDGADRASRMIYAKGDAQEIDRSYVYSNAGLTQTSTTTPAPTSTGSFARTATYTPLYTLVQVQDQGLTVLQRGLDSFGRVISESTPSIASKTFGYDAYNELLTVQEELAPNVLGTVGTFGWDRNGNVRLITDGAGHVSTQTYDVLGRFQSLTNGLGNCVYSYLAGTNLVSSITTPSASISNTFDLAGNIATVAITDADGRTRSGNRSFQYSALGELSSATLTGPGLATDTVSVGYDSLGRRVSESNSRSPFTLNRTYAPLADHLQIASAAASATIDRTADALGRPSLLQLNGQTLGSWQYLNGALRTLGYGNGTSQSYTYDALGRLTSAGIASGSTGLAAVRKGWGSDNQPHQSTLQISGASVETDYFETDTAGRVVAEQAINPGLQNPPIALENADVASALTSTATGYTLDAAANWIARTGPTPQVLTVDSANRYATINSATVQNIAGGGVAAYGGTAYQWDGLNQLTAASAQGSAWSWQRDALGRPTVVTDPSGQQSLIIWDGDVVAGVAPQGSSALPTLHASFSGQDVIALVQPDAKISYLHHGPDESVFAVTDTNGALVQAYSYSAFGSPRGWDQSGTGVNTSQFASPYLFKGSYNNAGLGLNLMGARAYTADLGRFLSPDPIGQSGGLNLFAFVGGRPLIYSDPTGTCDRPAACQSASGSDSDVLGFDQARNPKNLPHLSFEAARATTWVDRIVQFWHGFSAPKDDVPKPFIETHAWSLWWGPTTDLVPNPLYQRQMDVYALQNGAKVPGVMAAGGGIRKFADTVMTTVAVATALPALFAEAPAGVGSEIVAAEGTADLVTVTHFTSAEGAAAIEGSGALRAGSFVTLPSEVTGLSATEVESALEIQSGRGAFSATFQTPASNLGAAFNGPFTSGNALQWQLNDPVPIAPASFVPTPGP